MSAPPLDLLISAGEWNADGDDLTNSIVEVLQTPAAGALAHLPSPIIGQIIAGIKGSRMKPLQDALREVCEGLDLTKTTNVLFYANAALMAGSKIAQYLESALGDRQATIQVTLLPSVKDRGVRWADNPIHEFLVERAASISTTRVVFSLPPTSMLEDLQGVSFQHVISFVPQLRDLPSPAPELSRLLEEGGQITHVSVIGGTTFPSLNDAFAFFPEFEDEETAAGITLLRQMGEEGKLLGRKLVADLHNCGISNFQFSSQFGPLRVPGGVKMIIQLLCRKNMLSAEQATKINNLLSMMDALFPNPLRTIDVLIARGIKMVA